MKKAQIRVYEVVGRLSGSYSSSLKIKFVKATSKKDASEKSGYDYIKSIYWRKDIKPSEL